MGILTYVTPPIGPSIDGGERLATTAFDALKTELNGRIDEANLSAALRAQIGAASGSDVPLVSVLPTGKPDGWAVDLLVNGPRIWPLQKVGGKWLARGAATPLLFGPSGAAVFTAPGSQAIASGPVVSVQWPGKYQVAVGCQLTMVAGSGSGQASLTLKTSGGSPVAGVTGSVRGGASDPCTAWPREQVLAVGDHVFSAVYAGSSALTYVDSVWCWIAPLELDA